jgi:Rrf2 family protein
MITSKVEYLIRILVDLATSDRGKFALSREVAERQGIPPKYLPQLMSILSKKGWVDSARGAKGGVRLVIDPRTVTVQDVIEVSSNPLLVKKCLDESYSCSDRESCVLLPVWRKAQAELERSMASTTIAELAEAAGHGRTR